MIKRALFVFNWHRLTEQLLQFIETQATGFDELIFLLDRADERIAPDTPVRHLSWGGMMELLNVVFITRLKKPFYLLPVTRRGEPPLYYYLRWKILLPSFEKIYTDDNKMVGPMMSILRVHAESRETEEDKPENDRFREDLQKEIIFYRSHRKGDPAYENHDAGNWKSIRRGLFITRAQPFHLGHAAFLEQMKEEMEEVIVVLAMANRSHQRTDVATAGERMEMIRPWLDLTMPGRYYLVPLPYSDFTLENIYEMRYLLPAFNQVYTSNPTIETMAMTAGYEVRSLKKPIAVSSTMIRDCMQHERPYKDLVPESVYHYLLHSGIPERLKKLHEQENRLS